MARTRLSGEVIARLGEEQYEQRIRAIVESEENTGRLVSIDVKTGDFEIGDDSSLDAPR